MKWWSTTKSSHRCDAGDCFLAHTDMRGRFGGYLHVCLMCPPGRFELTLPKLRHAITPNCAKETDDVCNLPVKPQLVMNLKAGTDSRVTFNQNITMLRFSSLRGHTFYPARCRFWSFSSETIIDSFQQVSQPIQIVVNFAVRRAISFLSCTVQLDCMSLAQFSVQAWIHLSHLQPPGPLAGPCSLWFIIGRTA